MSESIKKILLEKHIEASAPCRIDSGGTWDIKAMALPLQEIRPVTVNIALNLRTSVVLSPHKDGWIKITSDGFQKSAEFHKDRLSFGHAFGLFLAAVSYFGFHGFAVHISSASPVKSALGGSSTALVALIRALDKASVVLGGRRLSKKDMLHLGYHLEDGVSGGNCGLQDQAAAVYGGVNQWDWHYGDIKAPFDRIPLLGQKGLRFLTERILVAYSGTSHVSSRINRKWITEFLSGKTRQGWIRANEIVRALAVALKEEKWDQAAGLLQEEMAIRKRLTPEALIPVTSKLIRLAEREGCGARFAGAGAGGSIWALGERKDIERLKDKWTSAVARIKGAIVLDCRVDPAGVR